MALISPIKLNIAKLLKENKAFRNRFFRGQAQDEIASKIRELRDLREMKQVDLAEKSEMKQSAISRIEQAEYSSWSFNTLFRIAEALEARLKVVFEPVEDVIKYHKEKEAYAEKQIVGKPEYVSISLDQQNKSKEQLIEPLKITKIVKPSWKSTDAVSTAQANQP